MSLIFVTGMPGSGKTSVCRELKVRGCQAFDTHEDHFACWYDKSTGLPVSMPPREQWATREWRELHDWHIERSKIEALVAAGKDESIFICGAASWDPQISSTQLVLSLVQGTSSLAQLPTEA